MRLDEVSWSTCLKGQAGRKSYILLFFLSPLPPLPGGASRMPRRAHGESGPAIECGRPISITATECIVVATPSFNFRSAKQKTFRRQYILSFAECFVLFFVSCFAPSSGRVSPVSLVSPLFTS